MPDLLDRISGIEKNENESAVLQEKIDRLTELVEKQKIIISDQNKIISQQEGKISGMVDIPDDIQELRSLVGEQRGRIMELEVKFEHTKGLQSQAENE